DRFAQNLRRVAGYDVQYFAAVEPQKRLAPHLHMAVRGTLPRAEIKQIAAATYHQVWWPPVDAVKYEGDHLPVWSDGDGYLDPATGEVLPTWNEALDQLDQDEEAEPLHVVRFGRQLDVQGVLAGTKDADQCIRYLSKYLTKSIGDTLDADNQAQRLHAQRLAEALRFEPCSATCPNWLRYGVQPREAKAGMAPGRCRGKAHKPEHLGYAGRRVLVSRKWSNKTLTEHKQDRRTWVLEALGVADEPVDPHRYVWRPVPHGDANVPPLAVRLLRSVHERQRWRNHMNELQAQADGQPIGELSATQTAGRAA
ncbi:MAG: replication initiation protein, partial [Sphaerisporangium sp.]|nr:replication initiation protein [Sphaerisporangium sp.]